MPIFDNRGSYLFVKITEPYSLKWTFSFLWEFVETCNREHLEKALVDGSILEGPISIWDRYQIGEEFVRVVGPKIKVFHEMESALKWLGVEE